MTALSSQRNLLLGFLLVCLAALGVQSYFLFARPAIPKEGSPEVTFVRDMRAHHAQAVEMAIILFDRSEDEALRTLALDILTTQQNQFGQMQAWLDVWRVPQEGLEPPMEEQGESMGMASQKDVRSLSTLSIAEAEVQFLQLMIRHHEGGVMMAESVANTTQPLVKRLAEGIIALQSSEIAYMEELLTERNAERLEPLQPMNHDGVHH
ncbi:MAG: DUF305 domain-containing protein [Trueperaceae bacterium]